MSRLRDHELWPLLYPYGVFSGSERMVRQDTFLSRGGAYLLGEDESGEPFVYHFNTYFYPRSGRFRFASEELSLSLGKLTSLEVDPSARTGSSTALVAYDRYRERLGLEDVGIPHMDEPLLRIFLKGSGAAVPNRWYRDPVSYFGYLVVEAEGVGEFCLVQFFFRTADGEAAPSSARDFLGREVLFFEAKRPPKGK